MSINVRTELDHYMSISMKDKLHLDVSLALIENNTSSFYNYGNINEHRFGEVGSITKVYTALLFSRLIQKNNMSEEDLIRKYIPELPSNINIRIIDLLKHQSGLQREPNNFNFIAPQNSYLPYTQTHLYESLKSINQTQANSPFQYSSYGYLLLGLLAQRVTGVDDFSKIMCDYILKPLKLNETKFILNENDLNNFCPGHGPDLDPISYLDLGKVYNSAGGLKSTVHDMSKFVFLLLNPSSAPDNFEESIRQLFKFDNTNYSASFGLHIRKCDNNNIAFFHQGSLAGTKSALLIAPHLNRGIAYFSSTLSHVKVCWDLLLQSKRG